MKRIDSICKFLDVNDKIIDVGCDHAYVAIKMSLKGCKHLLASDINENALKMAQKNIKDQNIKTVLSDGLNNIDTTLYDTLVIAGMGTYTIMDILKNEEKLKPIKKIILQSNNDLYELRKFMMTNNFTLEDEIIVYERKHYYVIMKYVKGCQNLTETELYFGLYQKEKEAYYKYLANKYQNILKQTNSKKIVKELELLKTYL